MEVGAGAGVGVSGADASGADVVGAGSAAGGGVGSLWQPAATRAASDKIAAAIAVVNRFAIIPFRRLSDGLESRGRAAIVIAIIPRLYIRIHETAGFVLSEYRRYPKLPSKFVQNGLDNIFYMMIYYIHDSH